MNICVKVITLEVFSDIGDNNIDTKDYKIGICCCSAKQVV